MPKYLRTSGITAGVEELIREARERLYIISPYLKLSDNIRELLNSTLLSSIMTNLCALKYLRVSRL
jgi:hypothetical protein